MCPQHVVTGLTHMGTEDETNRAANQRHVPAPARIQSSADPKYLSQGHDPNVSRVIRRSVGCVVGCLFADLTRSASFRYTQRMQERQPILQSAAITLKLFALSDASTLFALVDANRGQLRQWLAWVDAQTSEADSRDAIAHGLERYEEGNGIVFGVWHETDLVGVAGFNEIDATNRVASVGYWLGEAHQGRGIMTAACRRLIEYGFDDIALNRIEIRCASENTKSRAIPERLGFAHEGTLRQAEWLSDHFVDQRLYAILRHEWVS